MATPVKHVEELILYADDATFRISNKFRRNNQRTLDQKILKIRKYLNENNLFINMDKTVIMECMIKQKRGRMTGEPPELKVINRQGHTEIIKDTQFCKILGASIQNNLTWHGHLELAKKAILPRIRQNLGLMRKLGKLIPYSCRNTLARGMILSKLTYLISVWGGDHTKPHKEGTDYPEPGC